MAIAVSAGWTSARAQAAPNATPNPMPAPTQEPASAQPGPVHLTLTYYGDALGDVSGGVQRGWTYEGRLGLIFDADLGALAGWDGASLHASIHQIHGEPPTPGHVGSLAAVSGIEAEPATRLFNLWIEQKIGQAGALRVGQFTAAQEFFVSPTAALFVNSTFGWPAILAQDLPSGGPAYPLATPGVRFSYHPDARTTLLLAVFNGDPAGPGGGDPQRRDRSGLNSFRVSGPPFLIGEAQVALGPDAANPAATLRLGAWSYTGRVASQRYDADGRSLADPLSSGAPARLSGDAGVYSVFDVTLPPLAGRPAAVFARVAATASDRNLISTYADAGASLTGVFPQRPKDSLGVAAAVSEISAGARGFDADANRFSPASVPVRDHEIVLEASYQAHVTSLWSLQPDVQYVVHPGGGAGLPNGAAGRRIPDALVVGVRNAVRW
jgi:porin